MDLNQQNPNYTATATERVRGRDLYGGNAAVKAKTTTYLLQGKNESNDDYAIRLRLAKLDPWVSRIVSARIGLLFEKPVTRDLPESLAAFEPNLDSNGTTAQVFFRDAVLDAMVDGIHWVLIDMPPLPEGGYGTRANELAAGARPFAQHVPASAVIDWEVGPDGALLWAVIKETPSKPRESAGSPVETYDRWKVWTRTDWRTYTQGTGASEGYTVEAEGLHDLGVVPLVPFLGIRHTDYSGYPVCTPVHDHVVTLYNQESDHDWYQRLLCHPIPYFVGPKEPKKLDVASGLWIESAPNGPQITLAYLETTGAAFSQMRDSLSRLGARILSIMLGQAQRDTAQVQSGDGQREDRRFLSASLAASASANESAETAVWRIFAKWLGLPESEITVSYQTDFDNAKIEAAMIAVLGDLVTASQLSNETFLRILSEGDVLPESVEVAEEQARIAAEKAQTARAIVDSMRTNARAAAAGASGGAGDSDQRAV